MNENDSEARAERSRGGVWLYPGLVLLTWLVWGWVTRLGILGWDSYPLIAAGRVECSAEL